MFLQKVHVEKLLQKINRKSKTNCFSNFALSRFWAFLGEGSSKTPSQFFSKTKSDPGHFLASDLPTHHGGHRKRRIYLPGKSWYGIFATYQGKEKAIKKLSKPQKAIFCKEGLICYV
jgi:hypothetical protein